MPTIYEELCAAAKFRAKSTRDPQKIVEEYVRKIAALSDDKWEELSEEAKDWHGAATTALNEKQLLPPIPGFPEEAEPEAAVSEEEDQEQEKQAETEEVVDSETGEITKMARTAIKQKSNGGRRARAAHVEAAPRRGRRGSYELGSKITVLGDNPRRPGTGAFERHAKLKSGMTVEDALAAGLSYQNLRREVELKAIKIG
jgi:hypothetical protein